MVSKTKSDSDCVSVSHMVPRGRLTSYIGSMHDTKLHFCFFESYDIKFTRMSATAHSRFCNTCCVCCSKCSALLHENGTLWRQEHPSSWEWSFFFIIMWREQSDWCNKRNAERERSSSFSHFCVFFPTQVFLWGNLSTWGKLNSVHYWRKPSPACLLTMSRSSIIKCSCFWAKICIMTPSKKLMFLMSIWLTQEENCQIFLCSNYWLNISLLYFYVMVEIRDPGLEKNPAYSTSILEHFSLQSRIHVLFAFE